MSKFVSRCHMAIKGGRLGHALEVEHRKTDKVKLTMKSWNGEDVEIGIKSVTCKGGKVTVETEDFKYHSDWTLSVGEDTYKIDDVTEQQVDGEEKFARCTDGGIVYRLYSPEDASTPRPMILFLHGGGWQGDDNFKHLVADYGPIHFTEEYPDFYIMAPQAPVFKGWSFSIGMPSFAESSLNKAMTGWTREYLCKVCDRIRGMIAEGKVDPKRVYVTGLSMGGAGTIRAMSVGAGLFAAAAPVCPTMTPETFDILRNLTDAKLWVSTAYIDHTIYRHKYIVDAILALKDAGNKNAHLTLYSPEELAAYGIAVEKDLPLQVRFSMNHASWELTYNNEYGIMSWLTEQVKD